MTWLSLLLLAAVPAVSAPPSATEARAAVLAMADARSADPEAVAELARHADPAVRRDVARMLGHLAAPAWAPRLVQLSRDRDADVRAAACAAAGRLLADLPDADPARSELRATVVAGLQDASAAVRAAAAWAAGASGDSALAAPLAARAVVEADPAVRAAVVQELWRLPGEAWVPAAVAAASDADAGVRFAAARALGRSGSAAVAPVLAGLAGDADPLVRVAAFAAVRRGTPVDLRPALAAAVTDGDLRVRVAALDAVAASGDDGPAWELPEPVAAAVAEAVETQDFARVQERVAAIRAAGVAGCCSGAVRRAAADPDPWVAAEALAALARRGAADAAELVSERLVSSSPGERRAAVRAARLLPDPATAVVTGLGDADASVRLAAAEVAVDVADASVTEALAGGLDDTDAAVRAACVGALAARGSLPPLPRLTALLAREEGAALPDAAVAVIEALGSADGAGDAVDRVLADAAAGPDPVVARAAWAALRGRGVELGLPAVATGEPPAFYRRVVAWAGERRWLELTTERGTMVLELDTADAPLTAYRLWGLAERGYFDGLTFHRVVPDFVVQGGDPRGDGWGGPGFVLRDELSMTPFRSGVVGMALAGPDTGGSQLFVTLTPQPHLDGRYPVVGTLTHGLDVATRIRQGDRILRVRAAAAPPPEPVPIGYGALAAADLGRLPGWTSELQGYVPDEHWLGILRTAALRYGIDVVMGTWCSDSREQVPRLLAVLAALGEASPFAAPTLVGVDRSKETAGTGWSHGAVERVPTIVVTFEGSEVGRIVETPGRGSLEEDLVRMLAPYEGWTVDDDAAAAGGHDG